MKFFIGMAVGALAGCQSTTAVELQPQQTSHISQGVYLVEFGAAQDFSLQVEQLTQVFGHYCETETNLDAVSLQWHRSMTSWMALQGQERGPQTALEQSWNVQFWPDKKNTTGRKMSALLRQSKPNWHAEDIATQSVTVQGLGALEWLIYDSASDLKTNHNTCQLGLAISANLASNADTIARAWHTNPWLELSEKDWDSEYIALLSNQLDYSMKKLSRPLAKVGKPRAYFSESWRSGTSMLNLQQNIAALEQLYLADGRGLDTRLRQLDKASLADRIKEQFQLTLNTWPTEQSLFELLQSKEGYRTVLAQYNKLERLNYLIHEEVAIELGVVIGFNATDGD
ncbi:iron-regulated protein A [Vibrio sp. 404]|uniref:Iron-regulated protein A n=1 Tax=Vibrio marinisediminis TaxID=2758441 RepID=A0A7W2FP73_9VIBR|nr:imelysin family protein [Vibrio marinisediminis]MBA5761599.1 iron-regulated protein A [Vibrio marinisediminis]